ncbi:hypothetical protein ACU8LZ_35385 (plasmid) [Rhizobium leguminosarum]
MPKIGGFLSRQGGDFAFASLAEKRRQLREVEAELAAEACEASAPTREAA